MTQSGHGIDFLFAGGASVGLGHVVRCATIACEAQARGWHVRAFLDGDEAARATWRTLFGEDIEAPTRAWQPSADHPVAALDFPNDKGAWIERLSKAGIRSLQIDDARATERADWTLLPGLHHTLDDGAHLASDANGGPYLFCGARYAIIPEAHRRYARTPLAARDRILLSMGGADPYRLTPRIAPALLASIARLSDQIPTTSLDIVLGAAFDDPGNLVSRRLEGLGANVYRALGADAMAQRMRQARLAIIGFGTSLTELAWHGTPFLTVTHHASDRAPARDLEANGLGRVLGTAASLKPDSVARRISRALLDDGWQIASSDRAYAMLDEGQGARRLFEAIESTLPARPIAQDAAQLGGEATGGLVPSR